MKTLEVVVTQKHIDKGDQQEISTCAIALALTEQFDLDVNGGDTISVDSDEIKVKKSNGFSFGFTWSDLPRKVVSFIEKFDEDKKKVKPFSFKLPFIG